ncbi:PHP domain-containing protein [Dysosmobacter sp.]|uniref:PHP domain-containing protein n=1 Tax=Dysosmobacter sp. TaxID=2591382 RepID=UPI002A861EEA|nr:PHP domain-containing protein [Dysosmobacter sp.]MDY3281670.1 PHP domain-containing protein [Dysosmobacter sp.]
MKQLPYCDFHLHSDRSDGCLPLQELLTQARQYGIGCLCVTDHNAALPEETLREVRRRFPDMTVFQGCEFSANHSVGSRRNLEVHVIGLDFRLTAEMERFLAGNRLSETLQRQYVNRMIENLRRSGLPFAGDFDSLQAAYPQNHIGRAVVAREVLRQGLLPGGTVADVFDRYIGDHPGPKLAYTPKPAVYHSLADCVRAILDAGGIPILAHPLSYGLELPEVRQLMQDFADAGGLAAEAFYGRWSAEEQSIARKMAGKCCPPLRCSAASDFHGWDSGTLDYRFPAAEILPPLLEARRAAGRAPEAAVGERTEAMMAALENRDAAAAQAAARTLCDEACAAADRAAWDPGISGEERARIRREAEYACLLAGDEEMARRYRTI